MFDAAFLAIGPVAARDVAVGHLNGDGFIDLATISTESLFVYLGNGTGSLRRHAVLPVAGRPSAIEIADFNADGKLDVVLALEWLHSVAIMHGDGLGGFSAGSTFPTRQQPTAIAMGDLDADGHLDLVVSGPGAHLTTTAIMIGRGDGTFQTMREVETGPTGIDLALADLDVDGCLDLIVANDGLSAVSVLLGTGDGTFSSRTAFDTHATPSSLAIADLNLDGKPDVATVSHVARAVTILHGTGDGRLSRGAQFTTGSAPVSITCPDLNRDGLPDILVAHSIPPLAIGRLSVHLATGSSFSTAATAPSVPVGPVRVVEADVNADGYLDALVACTDANRVALLLGDGQGRLGADLQYPTEGIPVGLAARDIDGDDRLDLAVATSTNSVAIMRGNIDGGFLPGNRIASGANLSGVELEDMNSDGCPDLVLFHDGTSGIWVMLGDGNGGFRYHAAIAWASGKYEHTIADFDRDGHKDVAVAHRGGIVPHTRVCYGDGLGGFRQTRSIAHTAYVRSLTSGDVNGDGHPDLVIALPDSVLTYVGRGDGDFEATTAVGIGVGVVTSMKLLDFDLDGKVDLALVNGLYLAIAAGNGNASWGPWMIIGPAQGPSLSAGDLDGDALPDAVVCNGASDTVSFFRGLGAHRFASQVEFGTAFQPSATVIGDFNEDRRTDIAVATGIGSVSLLTNRMQMTALLVEDLNAEATPDLVRLAWRLRPEVQRGLDGVAIERTTNQVDYELRTATPLQPAEFMHFEDAGVGPGREYVYRLRWIHPSDEIPAVSIRVRTPALDSAPLWLDPPRVAPGERSLRIRYGLPHSALVVFRIHDIRGRRIQHLARWREPGEHQFSWSTGLRAGIYFLSIEAAGQCTTRKFLLPPGQSVERD